MSMIVIAYLEVYLFLHVFFVLLLLIYEPLIKWGELSLKEEKWSAVDIYEGQTYICQFN